MTFRDVLPIEPDEKGVIVINIDGTHRRFVKAKLIEYLEKETGDLAINQVIRPPKKKGRPRTAKVLIKKKAKGEWKRMAVVAILPDGTEHLYVSYSEAARSLKIAKSGINKCVAGKYEKIKGIKFKRAE
jgi:hypothetical protein